MFLFAILPAGPDSIFNESTHENVDTPAQYLRVSESLDTAPAPRPVRRIDYIPYRIVGPEDLFMESSMTLPRARDP